MGSLDVAFYVEKIMNGLGLGSFNGSSGAGGAGGSIALLSSGGLTTMVDVPLVLSSGAAYAAGDFVGVNATPLTLVSCARFPGGTGIIPRALFIDGDLASIAGELWLFDTAPTGLGNDSAAFTINDGDALRCIGVFPFSTYYASALNSVSPGNPLSPVTFKCLPTSKDLYGAFVTRGAPAYTSGKPTIRLIVWQD